MLLSINKSFSMRIKNRLTFFKRFIDRNLQNKSIDGRINKTVTIAYFSLSFFVLLVAAIYVGWHANRVYSTVQDATVYPFLFKNPHLHDIVLPSSHANILKFPLFILQSLIPYNMTTLTIIDCGLLLLTVFGWCLLLAYVFGKKYLPILFILMAAILVGSTTLDLNLIETTIRNIEYPIGLAFIILCSKLLTKTFVSNKRQIIVGASIALLFTLALAGDSFMLPAFILPIAALLVIEWLKNKQLSMRIVSMLLSVLIISTVIHHLVATFGIANYYGGSVLQTKIVPIDSFAPSVAHSVSQIIDLFGAIIFNKTVDISNALYFVNFAILILALVGIFLIILRGIRDYKPKDNDTGLSANCFVLTVLAFSFFTTLGAYIFSGLVVTKMPDGRFVDAYNIRYLTLIPFLLIAGVVFIISNYNSFKRPLAPILSALLILSILLSTTAIKDSWHSSDFYAAATISKIQSLVSVVESNNIHEIFTGDSLAAPIRFWSSDKIQFASLIGCNQYMYQNIRVSWRVPSPSQIDSALVIDRLGSDGAFFGKCSDKQLETIFGKPYKIVIPKGFENNPTSVEVWIYHYDLRQKLS